MPEYPADTTGQFNVLFDKWNCEQLERLSRNDRATFKYPPKIGHAVRISPRNYNNNILSRTRESMTSLSQCNSSTAPPESIQGGHDEAEDDGASSFASPRPANEEMFQALAESRPVRREKENHTPSPLIFFSPVTRSPSPAFGLRGSMTMRCPDDHKVMCRLIGLHSNPSTLSDMICIQSTHRFKMVDTICLAGNIRCIVLEETVADYKKRILKESLFADEAVQTVFEQTLDRLDSAKSHLIFTFNWFSPQNVWDHLSLGFQVLMRTELERRFGILGRLYYEKAEEFLWSSEVQTILRKYGFQRGEQADVGLVSFTGFSLGGCIAHALAFHMRESLGITNVSMRILGFGCPRPGSTRLNNWFQREMQMDSCNVVLYDETIAEGGSRGGSSDLSISPNRAIKIDVEYDPVPLSPSTKKGFDFHPTCLMLNRRFGTLRPLSNDEKLHIENLSEKNGISIGGFLSQIPGISAEKDRLWSKLHGIFRYYEAMHGLGDDL